MEKWDVSSWIVQIRTASVTRKRKRRTISWALIRLVADTVQEDIARSSFVGKESRCKMVVTMRLLCATQLYMLVTRYFKVKSNYILILVSSPIA